MTVDPARDWALRALHDLSAQHTCLEKRMTDLAQIVAAADEALSLCESRIQEQAQEIIDLKSAHASTIQANDAAINAAGEHLQSRIDATRQLLDSVSTDLPEGETPAPEDVPSTDPVTAPATEEPAEAPAVDMAGEPLLAEAHRDPTLAPGDHSA